VYPGDQVRVELGPGDDFFGGSEARDMAFGGDGNDVLDGAEGNDVLYGGGGLSPGSDQVFGGPGSDLLSDGDSTPGGPDVLDGGACFAAAHSACPASPLAEASGDYDSVTYRGRTGDLTLNLANGAASQGESGEGDIVRNVEHADTGEGDDTVTGNAAANIINTYGGNDTWTSQVTPTPLGPTSWDHRWRCKGRRRFDGRPDACLGRSGAGRGRKGAREVWDHRAAQEARLP
jgi:Ca2+-binding RTX toxin-like protein